MPPRQCCASASPCWACGSAGTQVTALGWEPVLLVIAIVTVTIVVSILLAKAMGFNPLFGFLSGGATAICGASAAHGAVCGAART